MSLFISSSGSEPHEVVIAGGGVAALETLLALHDLAGARVHVRLVAPVPSFVHRPLAVAEPFGLAGAEKLDLRTIAAAHGATFVEDRVAAVDAAAHSVRLGSGTTLGYGSLVLAIGASAGDALPGAMTFAGPPDVDGYRDLLDELESGAVKRLVFAVPHGLQWTLPLYELALLTSAHLAARGVRDVDLSLFTAERAPLGLFGRRSSDTVAALLRQAGVTLRTTAPRRIEGREVVLVNGERIAADRVVTLPRLTGPALPGVPRTRGFIPTDLHGSVDGLEDVYAAGDATWFPVKQGGIATQQADAVAEAIAAHAGAAVRPRPFRPQLRGALVTGEGVRFMRATGEERGGDVAENPLWWPPQKIAGRYLAGYLAGRGDDRPPARLEEIDAWTASNGGADDAAVSLALEAADADAGWGDYASALRWLDVAEQLGVVLPMQYAEKRDSWDDQLARLREAAAR